MTRHDRDEASAGAAAVLSLLIDALAFAVGLAGAVAVVVLLSGVVT